MSQGIAKTSTYNLKTIVTGRAELAGYAIVVLPLLIYWVFWTLNPSYWFNGDPAAFYMLDSLSVFNGGSYTYVDHPGTPMQVAGTVMLAATYPLFESSEAFIDFHIRRPQVFFLMANVFLLAANIFTGIVFYRIARRTLAGNSILEAAAVSLLFFTLNPYSFPSLTFWSHNSLNFAFGTLLLLWLFHELQKERDLTPGKLMLMGFAAGILAIAQIYFFVWMATCVIAVFIFTYRLRHSLWQAFKTSLYMILGGLLGNIAMLIPIHKELPRFIKWTMQITMHSGTYGTGEKGIFPLSLIPTAISIWWDNAWPMLIALGLSILGLTVFAYLRWKHKMKVEPAIYAMSVALAVHVFILLIPLVKAALKLRYTLSLAATLPLLVLMVLKLSEGFEWRRVAFIRVLSIVVLAGVGVSLVREINLADRRAYVEQDAIRSTERAKKLLAKQMNIPQEDLVIVYAFATPLQCSGMLEASNWTGSFKKEVAAQCSNQHAIFDSDVQLNTYQPVPGLDEIDWDMVVWPGNGSRLPEYLESVGAVTIPDDWKVRRDKWFYIHSEILNQ